MEDEKGKLQLGEDLNLKHSSVELQNYLPTTKIKGDSLLVKLKLKHIENYFKIISRRVKFELLNFMVENMLLDGNNLNILTSSLIETTKDELYQHIPCRQDNISNAKLNHISLTFEEINSFVNNFKCWYSNSNNWIKANTLFGSIKFCNPSLICELKQKWRSKQDLKNDSKLKNEDENDDNTCVLEKQDTIFKPNSFLEDQLVKSQRQYKNDCKHNKNDNYFHPLANSWVNPDAFTISNVYYNSTTRCTPFDNEKNNLGILQKNDKGRIIRKAYNIREFLKEKPIIPFLDFIPLLPIYIAKCILGKLDYKSLENCVCVSRKWRTIAEDVKSELNSTKQQNEDELLSEVMSRVNPAYARIIPLHIPCLDGEDKVIPNTESEHINVEEEKNVFEELDMKYCYQNLETRIVNFEERNIYCCAYNVIVLVNLKDAHRHISSSDGSVVVSGSVDGKLRIMDSSTGKNLRTFYAHVGSVRSVQVTDGNAFMLSGSYDTSVRFWSLGTGRCRYIFRGHKASIVCLAVYGQYAASGCIDKTVRIWNLSTGKCKTILKHPCVVRVVKINRDFIVSGCNDGQVFVWDIKTSSIIKIYQGHMARVTSLAFNEYHIVSGSHDKYAMVWCILGNLTSCLHALRHRSEVLCLEMMYGRIITGSADGKLRIWSLLNGHCIKVIRGNSHNDAIRQLLAFETKLIINTESNVLVYDFEKVTWNFKCRAHYYTEDEASSAGKNKHRDIIYPHSYHRAARLRIYGSSINAKHSMMSTVRVKTPVKARPRSAFPKSCILDKKEVIRPCSSKELLAPNISRIIPIVSSRLSIAEKQSNPHIMLDSNGADDKISHCQSADPSRLRSSTKSKAQLHHHRRIRPKTAPPKMSSSMDNNYQPLWIDKSDLNLRSYYQQIASHEHLYDGYP